VWACDGHNTKECEQEKLPEKKVRLSTGGDKMFDFDIAGCTSRWVFTVRQLKDIVPGSNLVTAVLRAINMISG
jgi:hypothetical protein